MTKNKRALIVLIAVMCLAFSSGRARAANWDKVFRQIESKQANYNAQIKDMTIEQEMQMPSMGMSSKVKIYRKGKKYRVETTMEMPNMPFKMGNMKTVVIYDGNDTWMISPIMGKKKLPKEEASKQKSNQNWWEVISKNANIVGVENVNGRNCYIVELADRGGSFYNRMWLDTKNLVLVKAESEVPEAGSFTYINSDFRKIKGAWEMPYKTEVRNGTVPMSKSVVKIVKVNTGLPDTLFKAD